MVLRMQAARFEGLASREIVPLQGTFDLDLIHAIGVSGYTEGDVRTCRPIMVLVGDTEAFERQVRGPRSPRGE